MSLVLLFFLGLLLWLFGSLYYLVQAFRAHILWGLGCLLLPIVNLFFVIVHWKRAWKPLLIIVAGIAVMLVSFLGGAWSGVETLLFEWHDFHFGLPESPPLNV